MRTSELYLRYLDKISALAKASDPPSEWRSEVESLIRQFHAETMPMTRAPFRIARDEMTAEFDAKVVRYPEGHAREVYRCAAELMRKL
jgi:hypothetical protein